MSIVHRAAIWTALLPVLVAGANEFVPFVIPLEMGRDSPIAFSSRPIETEGARVESRDGHFALGSRNVRVWGVNVCFGACFPDHEAAETTATRLAAFGVNSVRFHHMDSAAMPRGIWAPEDPMRLSAEALDRLDYFIDCLARRGIWTNLNLHVSRTHSRHLELPDSEKLPTYDKIVGLFTPALIDAQKRYARSLLTHVNAYRGRRYADDPAVAFVEITNENSLFMWNAEDRLRSLPSIYGAILQRLYTGWLLNRYKSDVALRRAWSDGAQPLGDNRLGSLTPSPGAAWSGAWSLGLHAGCQAEVREIPEGAVRVRILRADETNWHVQFGHPWLKVKRGEYYTLRFRARGDQPRMIVAQVTQAHAPWKNLGLVRSTRIGPEWTSVTTGFVCLADDENARVSFSLGASTVTTELANVEFRPGGRVGLGEDESLSDASVALYAEGETDARIADRYRFFAQTEKAFFDDMYAFLKDDLGCRSLVTGTIVFGPLGLYSQSGMDYIDTHAYWHHPRFPGRAWDPANWVVEQEAMAENPARSPLPRLAASRLAGKPFTVSEYNHPAPSDYQAECVPMLSAFAAGQDWDGIWLFSYSHRTDDWAPGRFTSFFDIDANPAKWGFVPSGAALFRDMLVKPVVGQSVVRLGSGSDVLWRLVSLHRSHGLDMLASARACGGPAPEEILGSRLYLTLDGSAASSPSRGGGETQFRWEGGENAPGFAFTSLGGTVDVRREGAIGVDSREPFVSRVLVPLDGRPLEESRKVLFTVCGRCENTGMVFSEDRRTVGRDWGSAPVGLERLRVRFGRALPSPRTWTCTSLGSDGEPVGTIPPTDGEDPFETDGQTMWYLLTR
jgi:carbohydrate binding protein with CBM4/9 domain